MMIFNQKNKRKPRKRKRGNEEDEIEDIQESLGNPCEIDIGILKILHEDISKIVQERLKEMDD